MRVPRKIRQKENICKYRINGIIYGLDGFELPSLLDIKFQTFT